MNDLIVTHAIASYECGPDHLLRPDSFMHICQEMAELHASGNNLGYEWSVANHAIWVEVQGDFNFVRRPAWKEQVTLRTNTGKVSALQARRFVEMTDADGNILAQADLNWVLIDMTSRRPVPMKRVNLDLADDCPATITEALPEMPESPAAAEAGLTATRRDVDFNGHINNSAYLIWTLDTLPQELMEGKTPMRVLIKFKHETMAGEPIHIAHHVSGDMSHHIVSSNGTVRAELFIRWA